MVPLDDDRLLRLHLVQAEVLVDPVQQALQAGHLVSKGLPVGHQVVNHLLGLPPPLLVRLQLLLEPPVLGAPLVFALQDEQYVNTAEEGKAARLVGLVCNLPVGWFLTQTLPLLGHRYQLAAL